MFLIPLPNGNTLFYDLLGGLCDTIAKIDRLFNLVFKAIILKPYKVAKI
jgi:hypothetical protein